MWKKIRIWWKNIRRTSPSPRYYRHITRSGTKETPLYLFGTPTTKEKNITQENLKSTSFNTQHVRKIFIRFLKEENVYGKYVRVQQKVSKSHMAQLRFYWNYAHAFDNLLRFYRRFDDEDELIFWLKLDAKWGSTVLQLFNKIKD